MAVLALLRFLLTDSTVQALLELREQHYLELYAQACASNAAELTAQMNATSHEDEVLQQAVLKTGHELSPLPLALHSAALLSGYNLWLLSLMATMVLGVVLLVGGLIHTALRCLKRSQLSTNPSITLNLLQVYLTCAVLFGLISGAMSYKTKLVSLWYDIHSDLSVLQAARTDQMNLSPSSPSLITFNGIVAKHTSEVALGPNGNVTTLKRLSLYRPDSAQHWLTFYAPLGSREVALVLAQIRRAQDQHFNAYTLQPESPKSNVALTAYQLTVTPNLHLVVALEPLDGELDAP